MTDEVKYTEDDLFRVLARPKLPEMISLYGAWWNSLIVKDPTKRIPFMKKYGWTWYEFIHECKRAGIPTYNIKV